MNAIQDPRVREQRGEDAGGGRWWVAERRPRRCLERQAPSDGWPLDALLGRARAAGARVVMDIVDQPYGSREFAVEDPEGYRWSFGTYRPAPGDPPHA